MMLAAAHSHQTVFSDLSVTRRDTVPAGFAGTCRAKMNFIRIQNILVRHRVSVCVISKARQQLCKHYIGSCNGPCLGYLFWDVEGQHVFAAPDTFVVLAESLAIITDDSPPPWAVSCAGGKRPKSKPKPKAKATRNDRPPPPPNVAELIQTRLQIVPNKDKCMARTFRLFQCAKKPSLQLECGAQVCRAHMRSRRRHGLMTSTSVSSTHMNEITKYLWSAADPREYLWYTRDIMWTEASVFKVDNLADLSDEQYMECLRALHDYWRKHLTQRKARQVVRGSGPKDNSQRSTEQEAYVGDNLRAFKFFDARVFQEELRGVHPQATPSFASEKTFMLALQYTNNRMTNWAVCRSLPAEEHYAGPQYYDHRFAHDRIAFAPKAFRSSGAPTVRPRTSCPGWLCCSVESCGKWRRVDADSLRIWDNRFFFEREVEEAAQFLSRTDSGFHKRLETQVQKQVEKNKPLTLAQLEYFLAANTEDDTRMRSMFKFPSVVGFLRQTFPGQVESCLEDDLFA